MAGGAQLSVTDLRRASRHPVDFPVIAEHLLHGDVRLHVSNISAHGFMIDKAENIGRGDRVIVRLPGWAGSRPIASGWPKNARASSSNGSSGSTISKQ